LVIGACGQIGSELTFALRKMYGSENVIASYISYSNHNQRNAPAIAPKI